MIKLSCDLELTSSNHENNLLQSNIRLYTIDSSLRFHIDENFMHRITK